MELLCIFAALAVLFLFCAFLTLKCNLHAALAPLSALGIAVAWLTAAGMANLLLPGTVLLWAVFAGSGVWALVPHKGQRPAYRRLVTPGAVLFWGMALAFAVYFFIRQPLATKYDELSLWATAVKVTKADNRLYALATLGTPWPQTQNPGLPLLSYFFQFLGHYADWKIYVAYDVLAAAVFAAVLGGLNFRQYRIAVPLAAICWFAPWFLTVYNHTIYLDTTYMTAYGDVPAGLALGGAVALWLALRKTGGPKWAVLPVLALAANIKANTFVLSLAAAGLMAVDAWLFAEHPFKKGLARRTGFAIACFAAPMLIYYFWNIRYVGILVAKSASEGGHRRNQRPLVRCGHQRHQDFAGPAGGGLLRRAPEPVHPSHGRYGPPVLDFGWSAEHDRPGPQCCGADSAGVLGGGHLRQRPPTQAAHWLHRGAVPCMLCGV